ncbi:MAG TPA: XRE family transcriptional regulator [Desulfobulbaceae bacterium]|nr:MAG: transcriptional regulator [Deltaproteobacteria bacterium RIFOXYD12_FULL_53_23]HCC53421.1 XRE family transcriptional regulator [Desulfobulbaceae bacterium]
MLVHTKKPHTETIRFTGPAAAIDRLRELARAAGFAESDTIPAVEINPALATNPGGVYLKGIRYRDNITQEQLAEMTGIHRRHISEMENGRRPIGKENAKKLARVLECDYRSFL